jgi:ribonuclease VapC
VPAPLVLDKSIPVALLGAAPGSDALLAAIDSAPALAMGAPTTAAAACELIRRYGLGGRAFLSRFLEEHEVASIPFDGKHWTAASDAFLRFGEGRHPANLDYGDCMTYATARIAGRPLLFAGEDFARTDLAVV